MNYNIDLQIMGNYNVQYNQDQIALGTQIKETLDKTYDMATLTVLLTDYPKEFQPYTPVNLLISEKDNEGKIIDGDGYYMIIESDEVEDVYIGTETKYNHKLTLIEATKRLETELMPNITFTQPVKNIVEKTEWLGEPTHGSYDGLSFNISKQKLGKRLGPGAKLPVITETIDLSKLEGILDGVFAGWTLLGVGTLIGLISSIWEDNSVSLNFYPSSIKLVNDKNSYEIGGDITNENDSAGQHLGKSIAHYEYKARRGVPEIPTDVADGTYNLEYNFVIDVLQVRDFTYWPFSSPMENIGLDDTNSAGVTMRDALSIAMKVTYSGIIIDNSVKFAQTEYKMLDELLERVENQVVLRNNITMRDNTITFKNGKKYNATGNISSDSTAIYTERTNLPRGTNRKITFVPTYSRTGNASSTAYCRILYYDESDTLISQEYSSFYVSGYATTSSLAMAKNVPDEATYYLTSIDMSTSSVKITNLTERLIGLHGKKYKFSNNVKAKARTLICPEFTFEKKTLWEICLEIGELFQGIPVLNEDNTIDYLIISDNATKTIDFEKQSEKKTTNMSNYATKLFTAELQNIIQDTDTNESNSFCVYPSPNGWIDVRCADYFKTSIDRQSSSLVIEGPNSKIYKVINVLCLYNGRTYDITSRVLEKQIYDSLSDEIDDTLGDKYNTSEKGRYLFYERGGNSIDNISQLPDNGSLIGWKQEHPTIQFILKDLYNITFDDSTRDIFKYKFRITYIPYHSRMNISRQSNLNDIYNQVTMNFNQSSNNISASQYGKHAENMLNKLGNPEIYTSYTSQKVSDDLKVGNCLVINDRNYYINNKMTSFNNVDKSVQLQLTKDNYKQNLRVAISREYRQYNIDSENQVRKTLNKTYTIIASTTPLKLSETSDYIPEYNPKNKQVIRNSLLQTLNINKYSSFNRITNAYIRPENANGSLVKYNTFISGSTGIEAVPKLLPVNADVIGNTITFQWDMYDNYSAGRKVRNPSTAKDNWWNNWEYTFKDVTIKEKDYGIKIQDDSRYCDDVGGTPRIYTSFFSCNNANPIPTSSASALPDFNTAANTITNTYSERELLLDFTADKDSREQLSCQFSISAQTFDKDINVYNLLKYNPLVSTGSSNSPQWYGYTAKNIPGDGDYYEFNPSYRLSNTITEFMEESDPSIRIRLGNLVVNDELKGAILCYDNGEILLDVRKPFHLNSQLDVYLTCYSEELYTKDLEGYEAMSTFRLRRPSKIPYVERLMTMKAEINNYTPVFKIKDEKVYLDLDDLRENTGLEYYDIDAQLVIKHNTLPRGILHKWNGRAYSKYKKGNSLYKAMNNIEYKDSKFPSLTVLDDGEVCLYNGDTKYSIFEYLKDRKISKQDMGVRGKKLHNELGYGLQIRHVASSSKQKMLIKAYYNDDRSLKEFIF